MQFDSPWASASGTFRQSEVLRVLDLGLSGFGSRAWGSLGCSFGGLGA